MDKFIIRTPRSSPSTSPSKKRSGPMKQATIESLSGVVIIEDLERAKIILGRSDTSVELKVDTLQSLRQKNPAKEVLLKTGIGKTVHKLCKHENEQIAKEATGVYKKWKESVLSKVSRPLMEVECDQKTKDFRNLARQMLLGSLRTKYSVEKDSKTGKCESSDGKKKSKTDSKTSNSVEDLAEYIEREVYSVCNRKATNPYRRTIRKLVFGLRHQHELRMSVIDSSLSVQDLVKDHKQS
ncbi:Transcription elongation factor A N-terminal and central domain-containing protein 2 [Halocaridina rubra]|uniref:Transcription elongation factor A N-terminal and central domain-containing protein 2 n=1 Tax=Halocaridina rubra TaxID=373956 RepID=A0AAN9A9G3_HALRR